MRVEQDTSRALGSSLNVFRPVLVLVLACLIAVGQAEPDLDPEGRRDFEARPLGALAPAAAPTPLRNDSLLWFMQNRAVPYRGVLLLSVVNKDTQRSMVNMLLTMSRVGLPIHAPVALCTDPESDRFLASLGINSFYVHDGVWGEIGWDKERPRTLVPSENKMTPATAKNAERKQVNRSKIVFVSYLLRHGFNVLLLDNDIVMVRRSPNGIDAAIDNIHNFGTVDTHIAITVENPPGQLTEKHGHEYNTGFYLVRSAPETVQMFQEVVENMRPILPTETEIGDQRIFNDYFRKAPGTNEAKHERRKHVMELSWFLYMSGRLTLWVHPDKCCRNTNMYSWWQSNWGAERDGELPYMFHFNFEFGDQKVRSMEYWKQWHYPDPAMWRAAGLPFELSGVKLPPTRPPTVTPTPTVGRNKTA